MFSEVSTQSIFFLSLALLVIGAFGSLFFQAKSRIAGVWASAFAVFASLVGMIASFQVLIFNSVFSYTLNSTLPLLSLTFKVDKLSAFFILVISLIALVASIYGIGYMKHYYNKYNIGSFGFFYNLFIFGMLAVVSASNLFFFLVAWEIMSLSSYFLVIFENNDENNIKAGTLYFVMTHIGTAFIMLSFLIMFTVTGSLDFETIKIGMLSASVLLKNLVFILAFIGFGAKAGIIPFHIWLPAAHPAAPSHVSALMSGVMIKTGIYMMIRIYLDIMPVSAMWWGVLILIVGSVSSLLGVLYALIESDVKKLLAYSSIENIGIILLGLGSALIFYSLNLKALAILALMASLFHILNHAIFKALLFMGAGSVISKTHTRNMEKYGGLIKRMPMTAFFFLVGAMAISALPPFNGFFSEWATYQALFSGIKLSGASIQWVYILASASLVLTSGLAVACFVKVFGSIFLARPRSEEAKQASENGATFQIGMGVLAGLTLLIGFFAASISKLIESVINGLSTFGAEGFIANANFYSFNTPDKSTLISMPLILISLTLSIILVYFLVFLTTRNRKVVIDRTWDCGIDLGPRMEITATGFSRSIITVFKGILKPSKQTEVEYRDVNIRYFPKGKTVILEINDLYLKYFYLPVVKLVEKLSFYVKKIQSGNVNVYILYIFLVLIALLTFLVI